MSTATAICLIILTYVGFRLFTKVAVIVYWIVNKGQEVQVSLTLEMVGIVIAILVYWGLQ